MTATVDGGEPAAGASPALRIRDLGTVQVEEGGTARPVPAGRLAGALALLLVHAGRRVSSDAIVEAMWGADAAPRSMSTVDSHLFRLRRFLEPARRAGVQPTVLVREADGYRLAAATDQVDSLRFARLVVDSADLLAQGFPERALRRTEEALASWRGRPYGEAADEPWAAAAVARLEELHGQVRETHIGALLATGASERALAELEIALAEHPLRERLWAHRMTAYRDGGRRADALRTYARARGTLVEELGIEPGPELRDLHAALLVDDEPAVTPPSRSRPAHHRSSSPDIVHLPVPGHRVIGREREIGELTGLVVDTALVTLAGPAGCGKTRLAVEVALTAADAFPDGVWFVDLTSAGPERVLDTVCSTVELAAPAAGSALAGLRSLIHDRRMLLVLDNCEHVLDAVAELVEELLVDGPESAVLATSREPLEVADEHVHLLEPLTAAPAVELFLERLDAVAGRNTGRTAEEAAVAAEIAADVDGLPLALELAAGRARAYSLTEIALQVRTDASSLSRIGRGRTAHHHTVRGAIDSSYRALAAPEAALHRAVGVVPGPFTVDLAAALVGHPPTDTADAVAGLVHRSLLSSPGPGRPGGSSRFAQLATVRGHALHQQEPGRAAARDAWVERLVRDRPALGSPRTARWYGALDDDFPALRATLQHTLVEVPSATGLAVVARLGHYFSFHGRYVEGVRWSRTAAEACAHDPALGSVADRAATHAWLGSALTVRGFEEGHRLLRLGLAEARAADPADAARLCADLVILAGGVFRARETGLLTEIAGTVRGLGAGDPSLDVAIRHIEAVVRLTAPPSPESVALLSDLHADARVQGNLHSAWVAAVGAALVLLGLGRPAEALTWARTCIAACVELGLTESTFPVEVLGSALALTGEHAAAARAFAVAEAENARSGYPWPVTEVTSRLVEAVSAALGRAGLERARAEGGRLTLADLVE